MKKTKTVVKKGMSKGKMVAAGAAVAAAAAAGAGAYYLLGPNKKAHQKKAAVLMGKIKKEVVKDAKAAQKLGAPLYHKAIDMAAAKYAKEYKAHEKDIKALAEKLKSQLKVAGKKAVKKTVKKATKKRA
jgi:hypothetical protein